MIDVLYEDNVRISQRVRNDPVLKGFQKNLTSLGTHLALNQKGEIDPTVMQESFGQIATMLGGLFHQYLTNLPLSKVEVYSPEYDVLLNDVKVDAEALTPDWIEIETRSNTRLSTKNKPNQSAFLITLKVSDISPSFKDFEYYFNHKTFPSYEDSGRASISTEGLSIVVTVLIRSQTDLPSRATLQRLGVQLGALNIHTLKETKHEILSKLAAPVFSEVLRGRVENMIYRFLHRSFDEVISNLNDFFASNPIQRATEAIQKSTQQLASSIQANLPSVQDIKEKAQDFTEGIKEKAQDLTEGIKEKAQEVVEDIKEKTEPVDEHVQTNFPGVNAKVPYQERSVEQKVTIFPPTFRNMPEPQQLEKKEEEEVNKKPLFPVVQMSKEEAQI